MLTFSKGFYVYMLKYDKIYITLLTLFKKERPHPQAPDDQLFPLPEFLLCNPTRLHYYREAHKINCLPLAVSFSSITQTAAGESGGDENY